MRLTGSGLPLWWRALLLVPLRSHEELASAMDKLTTSAERSMARQARAAASSVFQLMPLARCADQLYC